MCSRIKTWLFPLILILIALWSLGPVIKSPGNVLSEAHEDILQVWILNQTIQKIPDNLGQVFEGNIFYPYKNVMAYSDLLVPSALLGFLPVRLTQEPIVAFNTALILGQILTILVIYFWLKELTKDSLSALLGSIVLGLSQIRIHYHVHLQMWTMQWWLISTWMLWRYRKNEKIWQLYVAGLFLTIQVWESLLPIFWIALFGLILLLPKFSQLKRNCKHCAVISTFVIIFTLPVLKTYWSVSHEFDYVRPIREVAHFSMSVDDLWGKFLSPGLFTLFGISILTVDKKVWRKNKDLRWLAIVLIIGLIMTLGPALKWQGKTFKIFGLPIPLPYAIAYYLIPGFGALRTPSRWIWISVFAASGIIALAFSKLKLKSKNLLILPTVLVAIIGGSRIEKVVKMPLPNQYPPVYSWLKEQAGEVIVEMPLYTWGAGDIHVQEMYRMLYSLEHKKKLVNGYSGFFPPEWEKLAGELWNDFPSNELDRKLKAIGVNYVIVHKDQYQKDRLEAIEKWGKTKLIWEDSKTFVYELDNFAFVNRLSLEY